MKLFHSLALAATFHSLALAATNCTYRRLLMYRISDSTCESFTTPA